jgi:hypothetical protein
MSNNTKLKVGQVWRARDGSSHTIAAISPQNVALPVSSNNHSWTTYGRFNSVVIEHPFDLVELIEDAPEQTPVYRDSSTLERLERFALAETLSDYDRPTHITAYQATLARLNGEPPYDQDTDYPEWEAVGRAKLKVLRAKALLAALEEEGGEA